MTLAAVVLPPPGASHRTRPTGRPRPGPTRATEAVRAALQAGYDETVVVVDDEAAAGVLPDGATVLLDESGAGPAGALRAALDWCAREGHHAVVVALEPAGRGADAALEVTAWQAMAAVPGRPLALARRDGVPGPLLRLEAEAWPLVPLEGPLASVLSAHGALVIDVDLDATRPDLAFPNEQASAEDRAAVEALLGRPPAGQFSVVVRDRVGAPVVIRNAPLLADGTPMPTRYWLVGRQERELVGRLEAAGGVRRAEQVVPAAALEVAHRRYGAARDAELPAGYHGPRPTGGVGGTRVGVKCLHAHLASYLAGDGDPVGRWVVDELHGQLRGPVAAIDCGTNSTRLLVAGPDGTTLTRKMTITRLGEGVDATGELSQAGISRTVEALRAYREELDRFGVVAVRATATSAARDARNAAAFFEAAEAVLGVRPELLSGEEEGRLSYRGATAELDPAGGPYLVVDLGGGSTELIVGRAGAAEGEVAAVCSLDVGCVRITERALHSDPPTEEEVLAARAIVDAALDQALKEAPELSGAHDMVGVAGTVSTMVAIAIGLEGYDRDRLHHQRVDLSTLERITVELCAETAAERRARPAVEEGRADVIAGGALVLTEVMGRLGHRSLVYSESDILDGLVADLLGSAPG